jgi:hypothetical protein
MKNVRSGETSGTSAHSYLQNPDVHNELWKTRGNNETNGFLCNMEILLTEELKIYLGYFGNKIGHKQMHTIPSFSNIPLKKQIVKVPGNLNT